MPSLISVPMSEQRWTGYVYFLITPIFARHVSLGVFNEGRFHRGHLLGGVVECASKRLLLLPLPVFCICSATTSVATPFPTVSQFSRACLSEPWGGWGRGPWLGLALQARLERFRIPNDIFVLLVDGKPTPIEKQSHNVIYFSEEQFNVGLRFPLPSFFKQFLHFTKIPPAFIHLNVVRVLIGCNILDMFFHLDLSLLESERNIHLSAHIPFLQLVTGLPDSNKGGARGHVLVFGPWASMFEGPDREFHPLYSLHIPDRMRCSFFMCHS
ncbi:hypothetical protein AAG906_040744 [Vitis piasezkii]